MKKNFTIYWPGMQNIHLTKDVGIIPYVFQKHLNYNVTILCYKNEEHYNEEITKDIEFNFMDNEDSIRDLLRKTDVLMLFGYYDFNLSMIEVYKSLNPSGKIYLKMDLNRHWQSRIVFGDKYEKLLRDNCNLISVECRNIKKIVDEKWPLKIEHIPNGFYDFFNSDIVKYEDKENIILTVGRLGTYEKATEILMEAFKLFAERVGNWKLKLVGPVDPNLNQYIDFYFSIYPKLRERVIFTGPIYDRKELMEEYRKSKVFCLTSRWEAFAQVFGEAAFNGNYIITSEVDGALDITDEGRYGSIFPIDDYITLSEELIRVCSDEVTLKKVCGDIQVNMRENYDWIKLCRKIDSFL